jgi:hypothetical protein
MKARYRVTLTEYESGMGSRPISDRDFTSLIEATKFYQKENALNNLPLVPDYYISASAPYLVDAEIYPPRDY